MDADKCKGCINCMRKCPVQAIRVRNGKASIDYDKCISCGNCIRSCPNRAISARYDSYDILNGYRYRFCCDYFRVCFDGRSRIYTRTL